MKRMIRSLAVAATVMASPAAIAKMVSKEIPYTVGSDKFEGVLIYDDARHGLPRVLLVPNWMGINAPNLSQAELVAKRGYVVFVADLHGIGKRPRNVEEAAKAAQFLKGDRRIMRKRMMVAYETLREQRVPMQGKIGLVGFCMGGTAALELSRAGASIGAVVVFHAGLSTPNPEDAKNITGSVLALQGADDPTVPPAEVAGFEKEMRDAKRDWEIVKFGNTVHSFTDPGANSPGVAMYNALVAGRAYKMMDDFFAEKLP